MIKKLEFLLAIGIDVSFKRNINSFEIHMEKDDRKEMVALPFDHLNESKILKYISLMETEILKR